MNSARVATVTLFVTWTLSVAYLLGYVYPVYWEEPLPLRPSRPSLPSTGVTWLPLRKVPEEGNKYLFVVPTQKSRERFVNITEETALSALRDAGTLRRVIVTSPQETLPPPTPTQVWRTANDNQANVMLLAGEQRMGFAVSLAVKAAQEAGWNDWEWLAYGDDDTFFNTKTMDKYAGTLPPSLPFYLPFLPEALFLSEFDDFEEWMGRAESACCFYPDGRSDSNQTNDSLYKELRKDAECTHPSQANRQQTHVRVCSPTVLDWCSNPRCASVTQRYTDLPVDWCAQERQDIAIDWFFGGYGALFSRGLLESISMDEWDDCVRSYDYKKGDAIVAFCLQKLGDVLPSYPESLVVEMASNYAQGTVPNASKTLSRQDIPECISSHGEPLACHLKRWTQEHSIYWRGVYAIWNQLSHYWLSQ